MTDMRLPTIAVCLMLFLGIGIAFGASDDMAGMPGMNGAIDNTTKPSSTRQATILQWETACA